MNIHDLRNTARNLFDLGVKAADPFAAVRDALRQSPLPHLDNGRHIILAIGKGAGAMMRAALPCIPGGSDVTAIVVTNPENAQPIPGCEVFAAGHPVPDKNGIKASNRVIEVLNDTGPDDHVLCLISGGGSALLPAPAPGLTLADKSAVSKILLANGFDILQMNLVRQHLSTLKGGGLARLAAPAQVRSILISDVVGDDPRAIASGPTATPLGDRTAAVSLLQKAGLWSQIPPAVRQHLERVVDTHPTHHDVENTVVCSNTHSLSTIQAAAQGWQVVRSPTPLIGDVADATARMISEIQNTAASGPQLFIWGGETTVNLQGTGKGGRNQELALRFSQAAAHIPGDWAFLSGGTDGRDGPTDAAGGLVDATSAARLLAQGLDADALLADNNSYAGLKATNDLLITGATGTNVADIQLFLRVVPD